MVRGDLSQTIIYSWYIFVKENGKWKGHVNLSKEEYQTA